MTTTVYQTVFVRYLEVCLELGLFKDVYNEGIAYHQRNMQIPLQNTHERLFQLIFQASLELHQFETAYTYYQHRKNALPVAKQFLATLDLIKFKESTHQQYTSELEGLMRDVIPDDIKLNVLKQLLTLYLNDNKENKALPVIQEMKKLDGKQSYIPNYLKTLLKLGMFDDAKKVALQYKGHYLYDMDSYLTLLKVYMHEKDTHKAMILDAEYETKLDEMPSEFQIEAITNLVELYKTLNNRLSLDLYQKKLKNLLKTEDKKNKQDKEQSITTKEEIQATEQKQSNLQLYPKKDNSEHLEIIIDLLTYAHQISETKNLRDFLRTFFMKCDERISVKDYIIFTKEDEMLYHYKKERLYDKQLHYKSYELTLIGEVTTDGDERFGRPDSFKYKTDVLAQKDFEDSVKYIYAYPLFDLGVFIVYLDKDVTDPATYFDLFKGIAGIVYSQLMDDEKRIKLRLENEFYGKILSSNLMPVRILSEHTVTYNIVAQKLLNVDSHLPMELFYRQIGISEVKSYQLTIQRLFSRANQMDEVIYTLNDKHIREKVESVMHGDEVKVISTFEDLSKYYEEKNKLVMEATVDYDTSLQNLNALQQKLPEYLKDKGSFMLVTFNDSVKAIYGYDVTLQYFKEFGQLTKKFFNEGDVYRFNTYQLFIYIPQNDIRSVTKQIKDYLRMVDNYESQVISYEKFTPKMSIIRYPVVTEEKNPAKLFRFLELSLDYLQHQQISDPYIFFEYRIYEEEIFEQQVIDYLNQAMETHQLSLSFNQIIDLSRGVVWQYESELMLENTNIDSKYLLVIAKKRNRLIDLEKFHIKMVCEFLHILEQETGKLIKITIPISKETFIDSTFNPYVLGEFQTHEIPAEFIRFKVKMNDLKAGQYIPQIEELTNRGVGLDTTSVDVALTYPFHAVHLDFKKQDTKWQDYIKMLKVLLESHGMALVIRDVKTKEQKESLESLSIKYIEGNIYKRITADMLLYKIKGNE